MGQDNTQETARDKELPTACNKAVSEQREANWQKLAEAVAAILADDHTPVTVHNELVEFVLNTCNNAYVDVLAPEILSTALPLALRRTAEGRDKRGLPPRQ